MDRMQLFPRSVVVWARLAAAVILVIAWCLCAGWAVTVAAVFGVTSRFLPMEAPAQSSWDGYLLLSVFGVLYLSFLALGVRMWRTTRHLRRAAIATTRKGLHYWAPDGAHSCLAWGRVVSVAVHMTSSVVVRYHTRAGPRELRMPFPQDWSPGMLEMMLAVVPAEAGLSKQSRFWRWCLPGRGLGWWEVFDRP
jgi:hypothetical protein